MDILGIDRNRKMVFIEHSEVGAHGRGNCLARNALALVLATEVG